MVDQLNSKKLSIIVETSTAAYSSPATAWTKLQKFWVFDALRPNSNPAKPFEINRYFLLINSFMRQQNQKLLVK